MITSSSGATYSTTADEFGAWSVVASDSPAGSTTLTATQTDVAGNTSEASEQVTAELITPGIQLRLEDLLDRHATISGVPDATVEVLVDGIVEGSVTIDGTGFAEVRLPLWSWLFDDVEVRYTAGGRTGPTAAATFLDPR